nr:uncharacterized protein LOC108944009 [Nicotiana tomentosiformis]
MARMEAILGPDSEPFGTFVFDHQWSFEEKDSEKESEEESMFNMMKKYDPDSFAIKLSNFLRPHQDLHIREKCAYLLCKLLTDDDDLCTWRNLNVSTQSTIKCMILDRMNHEDSEFISQELLRTVSKLV